MTTRHLTQLGPPRTGAVRTSSVRAHPESVELRTATTLTPPRSGLPPSPLNYHAARATVSPVRESTAGYRNPDEFSSIGVPLQVQDPITDVRTSIARQLTVLFEAYLEMFDMDTAPAEPLAFGVVGLVDSTTARWLDNPQPLPRADLVALLTRWVWRILDDTLRAGGIELDPDTPLTTPELDPRTPTPK